MASRSQFSQALVLLSLIVWLLIAVYSRGPAQAQAAAPPNVIAIGDSITEDFGNGGWRGPLKAKLAAVGQAINYVGSRSDGAGNHEAYGGATSCDFSTDRGSFMANTYGRAATWDIRTAVSAASPNIAIIDIGTNNYIEDYYLAHGLATTVPCGLNPGSLHWLWDAVVYQPGITGVVITTVEDSLIPDGTENVNVLVRQYVADRQAQGLNVCLGELPSSFAGLTTDQFHLNAAGKDAVAAALLTPTLTAIAGTCAAAVTGTLPVVTITASIANAAEPSTNGQFTVSRTGSTANSLTVNFTVGGSATAGSDYANIGTSVVIPAGAATAAIAVNVIDDTIYEGSETVVVSLSPNASYAVGSANSATVTIADNELPTVISVSPNGASPGDLLTVTWSGIVNPTARDWMGLFAAGAGNGSFITWIYVNCSQGGSTTPRASGACIVPLPAGVANGTYQFRLLSNDSFNVMATSNPLVVGLPAVSVVATANAAEPSTNGQFTVSRTGSTTSSLAVNFTVSGSATPGVDYANLGSSVVIPAGSAAANIGVNVIDDAIYEGSETVVVTLTANPAYIIGSSSATVTIADDDKPVVSIVATDAVAAEAGLDTGTFTVSRDGVTTAPLTVNYAVGGTSTNGVDYQLLSGSLTIPAGQASGTIVVTPIDDNLFEGDETVIVTLISNGSYLLGASNNAVVTITDDDKPVVSVVATDASAAEAGLDPGVFTVTRDGITSAPLTVNYTLSGTATNGVDYQLLSGSLTIPAGQASGTIVVTPIDDSLFEGNETVIVTLSSNASYVLGTPNNATVTITDDDKPVVSIVATDAAAAEAGLDTGTFTVSRDGITTAPLAVNYTVSGTATNGVDYQPLSGSLTIPAGQAAATIVVTPIDDSVFEDNETVIVTLSNSANYILGNPSNATVTIADNDAPTVAVVATDATAAEAGLDPGVFTVTRDGITTAPLTVNYTVSGTATNGVDYQPLSGSLTIPVGQASATIVVTPIDDNLFEGIETVIVTLSNSANYILGNPSSATVTIADDDKPVVSVVATDATAAEAGLDPGVFTVTRDGVTTAPLTVNYTLSGTATNGVDYQLLSGSLTIPAGQASATIVVTPIDDSAPEGNETVVLTLTTDGGYITGSPNSATVTIADNDAPGLTVSPSTVLQGGSVTATWSGIANPSGADWMGLYAQGSPNTNTGYLDWIYVSCVKSAGSARPSGSCSFTIPGGVANGTYEIRLLSNNSYGLIAASNAISVGGPPLPVVSIAAASNAAEPATNGQFMVSRTGSTTNPLTVNFTVSGTATAGSDYVSIGSSVVIPANAATAPISVSVIDDGIYEGSETVIVALSGGANYTVGNPNSATVTITDDEPPPAGASITATPGTVLQGGSVTATWSGIAAPSGADWMGLYAQGSPNTNTGYLDWIYVSCVKSAGSARPSGSCSFTIPGGVANGSYEIRLLSNNSYGLIAASNAISVGGPPLPVVSIAAASNAAEPATNGQFMVSRTGSTTNPLTVNFTVSGTATAGSDYVSIGSSVVIPANAATAPISVSVIDDGNYEGSETVIVALSGGANYTVGNPNIATVTIADDEPAPAGPIITVAPSTITAGNSVTVNWSGITAPSATDWIGLHTFGSLDTTFWAWAYVSCTTSATTPRDSGSCSFQIPANPPGTYELRLFSNNGFTRLATSNPLTLQ